jgi:hypothetical protein
VRRYTNRKEPHYKHIYFHQTKPLQNIRLFQRKRNYHVLFSFIHSHKLTYISATTCFMPLGHQATKPKFVLFSVGVRNQNKLNLGPSIVDRLF